jgi:hypothetical protein
VAHRTDRLPATVLRLTDAAPRPRAGLVLPDGRLRELRTQSRLVPRDRTFAAGPRSTTPALAVAAANPARPRAPAALPAHAAAPARWGRRHGGRPAGGILTPVTDIVGSILSPLLANPASANPAGTITAATTGSHSPRARAQQQLCARMNTRRVGVHSRLAVSHDVAVRDVRAGCRRVGSVPSHPPKNHNAVAVRSAVTGCAEPRSPWFTCAAVASGPRYQSSHEVPTVLGRGGCPLAGLSTARRSVHSAARREVFCRG